MRKLSKFLAITLCLAMLFSLTAMAAAGTDESEPIEATEETVSVQEVDPAYDTWTDAQKQAYDLYQEGVALYNSDIGGDLESEQAALNVQAMQKWYQSAEQGYFPAVNQIFNVISSSAGGFVKDAETNEQVAVYGRSMGLNIDGESGWSIMRRIGQIAIDNGLADVETWSNTAKIQSSVYTTLAECYGDDEALGVEPWAADYEKSLEYYLIVGEGSFKTYRYVAELYWFGHLAPPDGQTVGEISLYYMEKAVESKDATATFYLGLWYLEDGADGGPTLPVPEGETSYTMAVKYLEAGREIANHGTIRKTQESLQTLAEIYEYGLGAPEVPQDLNKALEVYQEMLGEQYYPGNEEYTAAVARVEAKIAAQAAGEINITLDGTNIAFDVAPRIENDRTLVPYRAICEALGLEVVWDDAARTVTVTNGTYNVVLTIGSDQVAVNNDTIKIDVPAKIVDDRTLVPLRFIAETFDYEVDWDGDYRLITITTPDGYHPGEAGEIVASEGRTIQFGGHEWLVVEEKSDRILIVMKDNLEEKNFQSEYTQVTWEDSDMRAYLNGDFYSTFTEEEQAQIIKTSIANPYNDHFKTLAGNTTDDNIFLLSQEEVEAYFPNGTGGTSSTWWTRTPGIDQRFRVMVTTTGDLNSYGWRVNNPLGGVRPAMWISQEIPDPGSHPVMNVTPMDRDTLLISFDRAMSPVDGAFTVDKDGTQVDLASVKWSEDNMSIAITLYDGLSEGTYNIHMRNVVNNRTNEGTFTVSLESLFDVIAGFYQ